MELLLEFMQDPAQLLGDVGQSVHEGRFGVRGTPAGNDVLTLCVKQHINHWARFACRRIARERNARTRLDPSVAKHHGLYGHSRAGEILELLQSSVCLSAFTHPGCEHRARGVRELTHRIFQPRLAFNDGFVGCRQALQGFAIEIGSRVDVLRPQQLRCCGVKRRVVDAGDDGRVALDEARATVPCKSRIARHSDQAADGH